MCPLAVGPPEQPRCRYSLQEFIPLAAQCEITPPYRAIPFRDSIAEWGIARVLPCLHRVYLRGYQSDAPVAMTRKISETWLRSGL